MAITSTSRGSSWSDNEVRALISIWGEENIQEELDGAVRNQVIFNDIATKMCEKGYVRDWQQRRTKIKNLKKEYQQTKDHNGQTEEGGKYANFIKNWTVSWVIGQHQCQQFYWILGPPAIAVVPQKPSRIQ